MNLQAPKRAPRELFVGVADNVLSSETAVAASAIRDLGFQAARINLLWQPGSSALSAKQVAGLDRVVRGAPDLRIVVASRSDTGLGAPRNAAARHEYCSFLGDVVSRYPQVRDVVVWLEPNKNRFWAPQFRRDGSSAAPRAYVALLATCWDLLHSLRSDVNVLAPSTTSRGNNNPLARRNISHSPGNFIREMGRAYRKLARSAPIFDTVSHHPYGERSSERPWKKHLRGTTIGQGDWQALMQAYYDAFAGTAQPIPGEGATRIWYLESGHQTLPALTKAHLYSGRETDTGALPDVDEAAAARASRSAVSKAPDQATQTLDAVRLAYCQPYVASYFNFLLFDQTSLNRWQSAPFWSDRTPKRSAKAFRQAAHETSTRTVRCKNLPGDPLPKIFVPKLSVGIERLAWPARREFNWRHSPLAVAACGR